MLHKPGSGTCSLRQKQHSTLDMRSTPCAACHPGCCCAVGTCRSSVCSIAAPIQLKAHLVAVPAVSRMPAVLHKASSSQDSCMMQCFCLTSEKPVRLTFVLRPMQRVLAVACQLQHHETMQLSANHSPICSMSSTSFFSGCWGAWPGLTTSRGSPFKSCGMSALY